MKNYVLFFVLCFFTTLAYAQNKSLGVGTATPNPNAALDVSSPTNNQGALMPRLTTAQRTAMTGILGAADAGLLLYDNDEKILYIWNGSAWESSAKLRYPQVDTISTLPANGNALRIVYNGTDVGNFGVAHFENMNPNSGFSAVFGRTNSATNGAADFMVSNPANTNDAVGVSTNALNGRAGAFLLNNPGSRNHALYAQSNGDSTGSAVHGNNIGNGFGLFGKSAGTKFASAAVYGEHVGTGDAAGAFRINNVANPNAAVYAETNGNTGAAVTAQQIGTAGGHAGYFQVGSATNIIGTGAAVFGVQFGTGRAGQFQIGNATNASAALRGFTNGLSNAGFFTVSNPANDAPALMGETNGVGAAIYGLNSGPGDSFSPAGHFVVNNATNNHAAVQGNNSGNGPAGRFLVESASNTASAVDANTQGTGSAGSFSIANAGNSSNAVNATTNGSGNAVSAINNGTGFGLYARAIGTSDALYATKQAGDGAGSAGNFDNQNSSNPASTLFAMTNAGTGSAIGAINSANGNALAIFTGGLKVSTATLNAGTNTVISTRAMAYFIEDASLSFTFSGGVSFNEGDMIYIFNGDAGNATIDGFVIPSNQGIAGIYMTGSLRFFAYTAP